MARQGECLELGERILWYRNSELLWNVPRSQSFLENSESWRFWIATPYTEPDGYCRKRFWTSTCSRRDISVINYPVIQKKMASSYCEGVPGIATREGEGLRREQQSSTIPTPRLPVIMILGILCIVLEELILKSCISRNCISDNSQTQMTFSAVESTSRPKCVYTVPSSHNVVDQWSGDGKIDRRSFDTAIDWRAKRHSWFWNAWCEGCVCVEKNHL